MKPLDPRLLRYAAAARAFLVGGALLGLAQTACTVAFAWWLTAAVVAVVEGRAADELAPALLGVAVTVAVRAVVLWALDTVAARSAVTVKSQLRGRVVDAIARRGHAWLARQHSARLATLVGPGLDALDEYFAKYLPQLLLTAIATPLLVVVTFVVDPLSALIIVLTLPLVPIFMILIGWTTQAAQRRQWERLTGLATAFLDAVGGLSTLKAFGRERRQVARIGALTDEYRVETVTVLRVSFLSGFALELAASLSVALVAVSIGIRLVEGSLGLTAGLFVLLLTPEAYLPLRQVGANYHAAADGVAAADDVFAVLDEDRLGDDPADDTAPVAVTGAVVPVAAVGAGGPTSAGRTGTDEQAPPPPAADALVVRGLAVRHGDVQALEPVDLVAEVGAVTAVVGASGVGKSTLVTVLLGLTGHEGTVAWRGTGAPPRRDETAWAGQEPALTAGTVAEAVALGDEVDPALVAACLDTAGARGVDPAAPLGPGGTGLSGGQAQRVALARALYRLERRGCRLLLVDEPTSALDPVTEAELVAGLRRVAAQGVAVVVVTHRPAVRAAADAVVTLERRAAEAVAS